MHHLSRYTCMLGAFPGQSYVMTHGMHEIHCIGTGVGQDSIATRCLFYLLLSKPRAVVLRLARALNNMNRVFISTSKPESYIMMYDISVNGKQKLMGLYPNELNLCCPYWPFGESHVRGHDFNELRRGDVDNK